MHYVGIDLAWGDRAPSGLAVLDADGTLIHLSRATTDDTIVDALAPFVAGDCIVGIDAPLIVTNDTGNRPAETALNRDFARFDAGAHPVNAGKSELSGVPRAARLATRLALSIAPDPSAPRRAIEVYPHPALVALFRLGRTLKYKQRSNRPFPTLHAEMLRLVAALESLDAATPPLHLAGRPEWVALTTTVTDAARKSELRRAEDQLDAVVAAYVAQLAGRRPASLTTYGDAASGFIVTPTLPQGHTPTPRQPVPQADAAASVRDAATPVPDAATADHDVAAAIRDAVRAYAQLQPEVEELAHRLAAWLQTVLDDAGIDYLNIAARGKGVASFALKTTRSDAGRPCYADPLRDVTDQIGVRVLTYVSGDVAAVAGLIADQLPVVSDLDLGLQTASAGRFGYASRHLQVALDPSWTNGPTPAGVRVSSAQIQIRTVLQHAWAQFEHDIRYKGTIPEELAPDLDRRFTLAAGLLELADREFEVIRDRLRERMTDEAPEADADDPRIGHQDLSAFLAGHYPEAGWSRADHYAWMSGLLLELGITSLRELSGLLAGVDSAALTERMGYRYPPGAVRRLDDALLALFGGRYLALHGNAHRVELLTARLEKLRGATPRPDGSAGA